MSARIRMAAALLAAAATLTSCTVGNPNPPASDTGVSNAPTGAPAPTPTPTSAPTDTPAPEAVATSGPAAVTGPGAASTPQQGTTPGQPIPASALTGSRTAKQMRYVASRLDAYLKANGVPANWATSGGADDCFSYIDVTYTPEESAAWDNDIMVPHKCFKDGSYQLSGWSQSGKDPKYRDFNSSLNYESGKGFVTS